MSVDKQVYERSSYTWLDWLGDVGGLYEGLRGIGFLLLMIISKVAGNPLDKFLIKRVLKSDKSSDANE